MKREFGDGLDLRSGFTPECPSERQGFPITIFDTNQGLTELTEHVRKKGIVPDCDRVPVFGDFVIKAKSTTAPHAVENEDAARDAMHTSLSTFYGLTPEGENPEIFFQRQIDAANKQIERIVTMFFPGRDGLRGLNEALHPHNLITAAYQVLSPFTEKRLQFELTTRIGLAMVEAELDEYSRGGRERLIAVQNLFNEKLFEGNGRYENIYSIHEKDTNRVHPAPEANNPHKKDYISSIDTHGLPTDQLPNDTYVRENSYWIRPVSEVGGVTIMSRTKDTASSKAIRKVIQREARGEKNGRVQPKTDVPDLIGMQFVVTEQLSVTPHNEKDIQLEKNKVTILIDKVKKLLIEKYGNNVHFKEKDHTSGEVYQGLDFKGKRLMVTFSDPDAPQCPIEMWFHGIQDHIDNTYYTGKIDHETGKAHGPAHEVMEVERGVLSAKLLFPTDIYELGAEFSWDKLTRQTFTRVVKELQERYTIDNETALNMLREIQSKRQKTN